MSHFKKLFVPFLLIGSLWLTAPAAFCNVVTPVSLDTTALIGHPAGPFSINFQLNDGSGLNDGNNTATLSSFQFGGGGFVGSPILFGGASGDLGSIVSLTDSSFFNSFTQEFTAGTILAFILDLTTNLDGGPPPDQFSFSILDGTGVEIPTLGGEFFDVFVAIDIDATAPTIQTYAGDPTRTPQGGGPGIATGPPQVSAVPEPASLFLFGTGIAALLIGFRERKK